MGTVMKTLKLSGMLLFDLKKYKDDRGFFLETYQRVRYSEAGISETFVQDNLSMSSRGVLRGLHYQIENPQGKLVTVLQGSVYDVVVDLRKDSSTFGEWLGIELSSENGKQLFVPLGFAHGFLSLEDNTLFSYKCTDFYNPLSERTLLWNDPTINIDWPIKGIDPVVSAKDKDGKLLSELEVYE